MPNKRTLKDLSERNLTKNRYLVEVGEYGEDRILIIIIDF